MMVSKNCQSCGMPMKQDPQGGGTETDGRKSGTYCSYCYVRGQFTNPEFTVRDMQRFCIQKLVEMKVPRFIAWILTRGLPKLARWKR